MAGSNTDIPIVGGSILTHDHYQGGRAHFPIEDAQSFAKRKIFGCEGELLNWPLSTIRLKDKDPEKLTDASVRILEAWKGYDDPERHIVSQTNGQRHNAITPIVRYKNGLYEIDLVLRNNRCSEQYPDGIFHPHARHHHIKKENIGLIEVMGLAILPGRLKSELETIEKVLKKRSRSKRRRGSMRINHGYAPCRKRNGAKGSMKNCSRPLAINLCRCSRMRAYSKWMKTDRLAFFSL